MITINKEPKGSVLNAYNNCILEFTSDIRNIARAIITVSKGDESFVLELTPMLNIFYVNLKDVITTLINQKRFEDEININFPEVYIYADDSLNHEINININVKGDGGTDDLLNLNYLFFKSVKQIYRQEFIKSEKLWFLTQSTDNIPSVTIFDGFPFCLSVYSNEDREVTIRNIRTGSSLIIQLSKGVNRIFLTNGQLSNCGFNCIMPLYNGINELSFEFENEIVRIDVAKKESDCGIYLKWFNQSGSWSYWRFNKNYSESLKTTNLDEVNSDFNNIEEAKRRNYILGKEAEKELSVSTGKINKDELLVIEELFSSPKVYLYNSDFFQNYDLNKWIEVGVSPSSYESKNTRKVLHEITTKIKLPNNYTQTYAG